MLFFLESMQPLPMSAFVTSAPHHVHYRRVIIYRPPPYPLDMTWLIH